VIMLSFIL